MRKSPELSLIRQWAGGWEAWSIPTVPGKPPKALTSLEQGLSREGVLTLPSRSVVAFPLWVDSVEQDVVRSTVELEAEVRGVAISREAQDVVIVRKITKNQRTLAICAIYPTEPASPPTPINFTRFEAAPFLLCLEPNALSLWQEGGNIVAALTEEEGVVWWGTCDATGDLEEIGSWLESVQMHLCGTNIVRDIPAKVVLAPELEGRFSGCFGSISTTVGDFSPNLQRGYFDWKPKENRRRELKAKHSRRFFRLLAVAAASCLVLALGAVLHLTFQQRQISRLKENVSSLETEVETFQPAIRAWKKIGPTADPAGYPLEGLLAVVTNLPQDGIRLTSYNLDEGKITVEGEAATVGVASQFFQRMAKNEALTGWRWEMPTPSLLPNNMARFQIIGTP